MMWVNTIELSNYVKILNNLIDKYEEEYLNYYNEMNKSSFFWNDEKAMRFYSDINIEKLKIITNHNELLSLNKIYTNIINSYQQLGKIVSFDLKNKNIVLDLLNKCNEDIKNIISSNNNVSVGSAPEISGIISSNSSILNNLQNELQDYKMKTREAFNKIEEIEREITSAISSLNLEYVKERDLTIYI